MKSYLHPEGHKGGPVRFVRALGTSAASLAIKSNGGRPPRSNNTCVVPSRYAARVAAYCRWCGVKPLAVESGVANKSGPKARQQDIDLTKPVELIVLRAMERAARCRLLTNSRTMILRARDCWQSVPGQLVMVEPNKRWIHSGQTYLSSKISARHIDAAKLQLEPL